MPFFVQSWLGTPFRYRGYSKTGCDCAGLVLGVLGELGVDVAQLMDVYLAHRVRWSKYIDGDKIIACLDSSFAKCKIGEARTGDIAVFRGDMGSVLHLGVVSRVEPMYILHAHRSVGCVVETIADELLLGRLFCIYNSSAYVLF